MRVKVWGARGSVPTPALDDRYGGNTCCLQVTLSDGRLLVLDAGSGIRKLGLRLAARERRIACYLSPPLTPLRLHELPARISFRASRR